MNNHMQDFYSKNKTGVIVVVVVVLIIIGYFVFSKKSETTEEGMMNNTPATTIPATPAGATTAVQMDRLLHFHTHRH
jgi:ammonia channel protein AmtB